MELSDNISEIKAFLDDAEDIGKSTCKNHVQKFDDFLTIIEDAGLQIRRLKKWDVDNVEHLGRAEKKEGCVPIAKKMWGLLNMKFPKE